MASGARVFSPRVPAPRASARAAPRPRLASSSAGRAPARCERDRLPAFRDRVPRRRPAPRRAVDESYDMGSYDPEMDGFVPPEISLRSLKIGDKIGEGAFSEVYRGVVEGADGASERVVAKAYKKNVRGRDWFSFYADERATCRRLKEAGCVGVAPFLGVCGSDAYLVWRDVGVETLESCVARARSAEEAFDAIGDVFFFDADLKPTSAKKQTNSGGNKTKQRALVFLRLARSLLTATASMHANEVVHRDVKPENVLVSRETRGVLLVDLGGAADLAANVNCDPSETIFDPTYGAPEQVVRDKDDKKNSGLLGGLAGALAKRAPFGAGDPSRALAAGATASGIAPCPRLDAFAIGLTLLRVATPALYPVDAMARARCAMDAAEDRLKGPTEETDDVQNESVLDAWASGPGSESCDFALIDAAEAWSLIEGLATWDPERRLTVREALDHPCFKALE